MSKPIKVIFMGTPEFAIPSLQLLLAEQEQIQIVGVYTQPDRPKGRKRILTPSPVKAEALAANLPVYQPQRLRNSEAIEQLEQLAPDLIVTAAYGQILPRTVLELPRLGCVNIHGSLLPKYRGGAPIQRSIIAGEKITGVTLMYMAEGLDTGDMIAKVEVSIGDEDDSGTMFEKLSIAGAQLLKEQLPSLLSGKVDAEKQNEAEATYAPNLTREDEYIHWTSSAQQIHNQVRGLRPASGAFTYWKGQVFKVWGTSISTGSLEIGQKTSTNKPGSIVDVADDALIVQTGDGLLALTQVQPAGKKALPVKQFLQGANMDVGMMFGDKDE